MEKMGIGLLCALLLAPPVALGEHGTAQSRTTLYLVGDGEDHYVTHPDEAAKDPDPWARSGWTNFSMSPDGSGERGSSYTMLNQWNDIKRDEHGFVPTFIYNGSHGPVVFDDRGPLRIHMFVTHPTGSLPGCHPSIDAQLFDLEGRPLDHAWAFNSTQTTPKVQEVVIEVHLRTVVRGLKLQVYPTHYCAPMTFHWGNSSYPSRIELPERGSRIGERWPGDYRFQQVEGPDLAIDHELDDNNDRYEYGFWSNHTHPLLEIDGHLESGLTKVAVEAWHDPEAPSTDRFPDREFSWTINGSKTRLTGATINETTHYLPEPPAKILVQVKNTHANGSLSLYVHEMPEDYFGGGSERREPMPAPAGDVEAVARAPDKTPLAIAGVAAVLTVAFLLARRRWA